MEQDKIITWDIVYKSLVNLGMHSENVRWNRFNNFLVFNSILILSWATVWSKDLSGSLIVFLVFICVLGGVSGILWSILGCRGSKAVRAFMDMAGDLEKEVILWPTQLVKYKPATLSNGLRDSPSS